MREKEAFNSNVVDLCPICVQNRLRKYGDFDERIILDACINVPETSSVTSLNSRSIGVLDANIFAIDAVTFGKNIINFILWLLTWMNIDMEEMYITVNIIFVYLVDQVLCQLGRLLVCTR